VGCFAGTFLGDVLLFLGTRLFGLVRFQTVPVTWFIRPATLGRRVSSLSVGGVAALFRDALAFRGRRIDSVAAGLTRIGGRQVIAATFLIVAMRTILFVGVSAVLSMIPFRLLSGSIPSYGGAVATVAIVTCVLKAGSRSVRAITSQSRKCSS
jgi:hypothetical protein